MNTDDITQELANTDEALEDLVKTLRNDEQFSRLFCGDASENPYSIEMFDLSAFALIIHMVKDAGYGRSWAKHGLSGVFGNIDRKIDRISQLELVYLRERSHGRALIDTLMDLSIYCMMAISYLARIDGQSFDEWLVRTAEDVGMSADGMMRFFNRDGEAKTSE